MKRIVLLFLAMMSLLIAVPAASAQAEKEAQARLAAYMPAGFDIYASVRVDDGYLETLDGVLAQVLAKANDAGLPVPPLSLRAEVERAIASSRMFTYDDVRAFLGDHAAIGMSFESAMGGSMSGTPEVVVAIEITDMAALEAIIAKLPEGATALEEATQVGDYKVLVPDASSFLALGTDVALIVPDQALLALDGNLAATTEFQDTIANLPGSDYNILAYINIAGIFETFTAMGEAGMPGMEGMDALAQLGLSPDIFGGQAWGFTVVDGRHFTIDLVQGLKGMAEMPTYIAYEPLNSDFLRFVPSGTDALVWGTKLASVIRAQIEALGIAAEASGGTNPMPQIVAGLEQIGIDLEADILSWSDGNYAIYGDLDLDALVGIALEASSGTLPASIPANFAIVLETTDAAASSAFLTKLDGLLRGALASAPQVTFGEADINGLVGTSINIAIPVAPNAPLNLTFVIASNDEVVFIGTESAAQALGSSNLADDPVYQEASAQFLPNSISILYTNDEGLIETVGLFAGTLALLGPAVNNVFEDINDGLSGSSQAPSTRQAVAFQAQPNPAEQVAQVLNFARAVLASSSISSAINGEWTVGRLVLSLEP